MERDAVERLEAAVTQEVEKSAPAAAEKQNLVSQRRQALIEGLKQELKTKSAEH